MQNTITAQYGYNSKEAFKMEISREIMLGMHPLRERIKNIEAEINKINQKLSEISGVSKGGSKRKLRTTRKRITIKKRSQRRK